MKRKIDYIRVDPAGNITAFVLDFVKDEERPIVANKIMKEIDPSVEQVAFISKDKFGQFRMDMMGGEFCGNASRSFGLLLAIKEGLIGKHNLNLNVSGAENPVGVLVDVDKMEAEITLSPAYKTEHIDFGIGNYFTVFLEGIVHIIVPDKKEEKDLAKKFIKKLQDTYKEEAYGVMFLNEENSTMVPYVFVPDTDSFVRESSCGSGSVAAAYYLNKDKILDFCVNISQPGGVIKASFINVDGELIYTIGGLVEFSSIEEVIITG